MSAQAHVVHGSDDETKHGHEDADKHESKSPVVPSLPGFQNVFFTRVPNLVAQSFTRSPVALKKVASNIRPVITEPGLSREENRASYCDSQPKD